MISQKKAVKSTHRQLVEDKEIDDVDHDKPVDVHKGDRENDNLSSESEAESRKSDDDKTEAALVVPKETDRRVSITITTSDGPSNTFITDLKNTDLSNMVSKAYHIKAFFLLVIYCTDIHELLTIILIKHTQHKYYEFFFSVKCDSE